MVAVCYDCRNRPKTVKSAQAMQANASIPAPDRVNFRKLSAGAESIERLIKAVLFGSHPRRVLVG